MQIHTILGGAPESEAKPFTNSLRNVCSLNFKHCICKIKMFIYLLKNFISVCHTMNYEWSRPNYSTRLVIILTRVIHWGQSKRAFRIMFKKKLELGDWDRNNLKCYEYIRIMTANIKKKLFLHSLTNTSFDLVRKKYTHLQRMSCEFELNLNFMNIGITTAT